MKTDDLWASVGTSLSAIGATVSWLYEFPIVSSLFTFIVGAFVTFLVQSNLQDRSEKRKQRVKAIEELHIPLYLRFEDIRKNFLLNLEDVNVGTWNPLLDKPQMFTLKSDFKEDIIKLFLTINSLEENFHGLKGTITDIIHKNVQNVLLPQLKKNNTVDVPEGIVAVVSRGSDNTGFSINLERRYWGASAPILQCAVLNLNPISYLEKKHEHFKINRLKFYMQLDLRPDNHNYSTKPVIVDLTDSPEITNIFNQFWAQLVAEINNNPDISKFNGMRQELIPFSEKIISKLQKHIEKYVEIEEI